jgi:homoserine O-succinyltransferase
MPIIIPESLPTRWMLDSEGIFVIDHPSALRQDIRPLRIALVDTTGKHAADISRKLSQSPLQIELVFIHPGQPAEVLGRTLKPAHLGRQTFDGLIVADDPDAWSQGQTWDELRDILDWALDHVHAHLYLGLSAQSALRHYYNITRATPLTPGPVRLVLHRALRSNSFLLRGFNDEFQVLSQDDHGIERESILDVQGLELLAESHDGAPYLIRSYDRRRVFALQFPAQSTLAETATDQGSWRSHRALLLRNWINYYVYQPVSQLLRERDGRPAA